ncbi:MAG TPA: PQQ-binding-like beta-propeller repeat protein [Chthonomonadaceae bacterium]|nr:PQQ-binding-like beta-propeller repeat protein [Chthonomonadaceae bacterium]
MIVGQRINSLFILLVPVLFCSFGTFYHISWRVQTTQWRQSQADQAHSGHLTDSIAPPLHLVWRRRFTSSVEPIVAAGNIIYCLSRETMEAVDTHSGVVLWQNSDAEHMPLLATDKGVWTLVGSLSKKVLVLLSADKGTILLTLDTQKIAPGTQWVDIGVATRSGNLIVILHSQSPGPERLLEVDTRTGQALAQRSTDFGYWTSETYGMNVDEVGEMLGESEWLFLHDHDTLATLEGGVNGRLHGLEYLPDCGQVSADPDTLYLRYGTLADAYDRHLRVKWFTDLPGFTDDKDARWKLPPPLVTPDRVIFSSTDRIYALDTRNGKIAWIKRLGTDSEIVSGGGPVATGGIVYIPIASHPNGLTDTLVALSVRNGQVVWSWKTAYALRHIIAHQGALYIQADRPVSSGREVSEAYLLKIAGSH